MARGIAVLKDATDPIGPGTAAWRAFDAYVEALRENKPRKGTRSPADMRMDYLKRCLRDANVPANTIAEWVARARVMALDDDF